MNEIFSRRRITILTSVCIVLLAALKIAYATMNGNCASLEELLMYSLYRMFVPDGGYPTAMYPAWVVVSTGMSMYVIRAKPVRWHILLIMVTIALGVQFPVTK